MPMIVYTFYSQAYIIYLGKYTAAGFRRARSCVSNMIIHWDKITAIPVDVVYLDLQKAFDKVPHKRLIKKIKAHGIEGPILKWIEEWLNYRKQRVVLNGYESTWTKVTSSVIQGSVLVPVCFTIYMNDMDLDVKLEISKFASMIQRSFVLYKLPTIGKSYNRTWTT